MFEKNSDADDEVQIESGDEFPESENTFVSQGKAMFDEHKGKLAIGVAATLGLMIFYNWRERQLAKHDPEGHARLQRLKAIVRADDLELDSLEEDGEYYESDEDISSHVVRLKHPGETMSAN
jgi:hypothetical protein